MSVRLTAHPGHALVVIRCRGVVTTDSIRDELIGVLKTNPDAIGYDRIVEIPATADLSEVRLEGLQQIQLGVIETWEGAEVPPDFRTVIVTPSDVHEPISQLFKALWENRTAENVRCSVTKTLSEAAAELGIEQVELKRLLAESDIPDRDRPRARRRTTHSRTAACDRS